MNKINNYNETVFESIKHIDNEGNEFWYARELMTALEYSKWEHFAKIIDKAKISCNLSSYSVEDHFPVKGKIVKAGATTKEVIDYKLSRYACYLIVQNASPARHKSIALGQTYFAVQTRKMELTEKEYSELTEDEKRFYQRSLTKRGNYSLNIAAKNAGVKNFDKFHNAGYRGLYNGETANDIAKRKKLKYREDILDNMGEDELVANLFRINQTKQKLEKDNIQGELNANNTHYEVGKKVRKAIADIGGTMPEGLPTPDKSLKELEKYYELNNYKRTIKR